MEVAEKSGEFDLTRSCDYLYRTKWILSLKIPPRMTVIDSNPMVSVVDMIKIHGDYEDDTKPWTKMQGKPFWSKRT